MNSGLHFPLGADASARTRCAASAARATATGGSPTRRSSSTPPAASPPRTPIPAPMRAAGAEFLALLKKYRSRRPLNGVILTVSVGGPAHAERRPGAMRTSQAARRRLEELNRELRIRLPIYVHGHQVRPDGGVHRVLRRPRPGGAQAGLGRHLPVRGDAQGRTRRSSSRRSSTRWSTRLNERVFERARGRARRAPPRAASSASRSSSRR